MKYPSDRSTHRDVTERKSDNIFFSCLALYMWKIQGA